MVFEALAQSLLLSQIAKDWEPTQTLSEYDYAPYRKFEASVA